MTTTARSDSSHMESLYTAEWLPGQTPRGCFLLLHGIESHAEWFARLAAGLTARGWAVIAYDRSGWGKSPGSRGHLGSYRHFVEEAMLAARMAREKYPAVHLAGMSWGGMASLYLALRRGWMFDSVSLLAPGLAARRDITGLDKLAAARAWLRSDLSKTVSPVFRPEDFTADPNQQRFIAEDRHRVRVVTVSFCLETLKMRRFIKETVGRRLTPPLLALLAEKDDIVDNPRTAVLCRRAGGRLDIVPGSRHSLALDKPDASAERLAAHADAAQRERQSRQRRVWVVGGGAVGGAVGSLLSFAGVKTGILVKPQYLDRFTNGVSLQSGSAIRVTDAALQVAADPAALPADPELVIVALKSFDTEAGIAPLAGRLPAECVVTTLQNGVGNEERLARAFPDNPIAASAICASLEMPRPGVATLADDRGGLGGALYRGDTSHAMAVWASILALTGMECRWYGGTDAAARLKWSKLMLNTGFNALNSLTGLSSAAILADEENGRMAVAAIREGFAVMRALRLQPVDLPGYQVSALARVVKLPVSWARRAMAWQAGRAPEASFSMLQDLWNNRRTTEIDELNGKVASEGARLGVATPANERLVAMVRERRQLG